MSDSSPNVQQQVTRILQSWKSADHDASQKQLSPIIYETLRRLSRRFIRQEKQGYTLQTTELVHEAYSLLVDTDIDWKNRQHFYAVAAKTMRRLLIDRAREKKALKRGHEMERITFEESSISGHQQGDDILALEESLQQLAQIDERKTNIVELHYYAGLTYPEIALVLNISEATVDRELRFSKAWLASRLQDD